MVYRLDSINNYYFIYAKKKETIFKIISKKDYNINCSSIKPGGVYDFQLHSMLSINGRSVIPANQMYEVSGMLIDDSTTVNFEGDSIRDFYIADNIKGLCFIINKKAKDKVQKRN